MEQLKRTRNNGRSEDWKEGMEERNNGIMEWKKRDEKIGRMKWWR